MRRSGRPVRWEPVGGAPETTRPLDVDLEAVDADLQAAGEQARRMLQGQTQPTRFFANQLRDGLVRPRDRF